MTVRYLIIEMLMKMFLNVYKHLFKIGWWVQMLLTLLEIHVKISTVAYVTGTDSL